LKLVPPPIGELLSYVSRIDREKIGHVVEGKEGFASRAALPLVRELIDTGAVVLWPISRFTHTIAGIGAAAAHQWDAAEEHFHIALQQAGSFPQILEQAEIRRFYGAILLERGKASDRKGARKMLPEGLETDTNLGMPLHCDLIKAIMGRVH
jgi:hypothetical protein